LRIPARDMWGARLALEDVGLSRDAFQNASGASGSELRRIICALVGLFRQRETLAGADIAIRAADIIASRHGRISAYAVASALGCSTRHLHREMIAGLGMGPKTAARIARIRRAIMLLGASGQPLAQIAYEAGYSDQAHMTREFAGLKVPGPARLRHWRESDFVNTSGPDQP